MTPAIDNDGWLIDARRRLSPNCDERPADCGIDLAVLHGISLPPGEFGGDDILRLFENRLDCSAALLMMPCADCAYRRIF